ncbi:MAG: ABC transporter ATP-binding protein [Parachlamydiales bacterium]
MKPLLRVRNLTTRFSLRGQAIPVVDGISFDLHAGKTLALVGESGCGKSVTALSLMGILPTPPALPPTGEVLYQGKNLLTLPERKMRRIRGRHLAMIFQDPMSCLTPVYTIGDQLLEVAYLHLRLKEKGAKERVIQALHEVQIPDPEARFSEYPHQLSGGMKQRVMIAMALLAQPDILIADEPTTALDVTIQAQILDLIRHLQQKRGMATLLITHDMGVVAELADEVAVMYASKIVERGPVAALFDSPKHPYTQGLFASRPRTGRLTPIPGTVPPLTHRPPGCPFHPRCPHATDRCRTGELPTATFADGHETLCHLYQEAPC